MLSMTGFGRGSAQIGDRQLRVEIRSVNHRGLDLKIRSREPDGYCESEITRMVRAGVERGSLSVHIREEAPPGAGALDDARIKDLRTGVERRDTQTVLDGDLDDYVEASLKQGL